jgi:hypothetical protein
MMVIFADNGFRRNDFQQKARAEHNGHQAESDSFSVPVHTAYQRLSCRARKFVVTNSLVSEK